MLGDRAEALLRQRRGRPPGNRPKPALQAGG